MSDVLRVVKFSLRDLWDEFVLLVMLNAVWGLATVLPSAPFFFLEELGPMWSVALAALLFLPWPIVMGAICWVTNQMARGRAVGWSTFAAGIRNYWSKSLVVAVINVLVVVLIWVNVRFYSTVLQGPWSALAVLAWAVVAVYWLLVQVFWFPMLLELESERVILALKSALSMVVMTPGFTLPLAITLLVLGLLSVLLPVALVLLSAVLFFLLANHATRSRLAWAHKKPYEPTLTL